MGRRRRRGDSGDRERLRLAAAATPPFVSGLLGTTGGASRRGSGCFASSAAHPFLGHLRPSSRRPQPSARDAQPELRPEPRAAEDEAAAAAAATVAEAFLQRSCDSLTPNHRREEIGLSWWSFLQARAKGWSSRERGRRPSALGGPAPHLPACRSPGLAAPPRPSPPLPRARRPGLRDPRAIVPRKPWARPWKRAPFSTQSVDRIC